MTKLESYIEWYGPIDGPRVHDSQQKVWKSRERYLEEALRHRKMMSDEIARPTKDKSKRLELNLDNWADWKERGSSEAEALEADHGKG